MLRYTYIACIVISVLDQEIDLAVLRNVNSKLIEL